MFSQRRNFMPLVGIYFLTLPDTTAQQIGVFMSIGCVASFLGEIPSGYFADVYGHKRTLLLAKILMTASLFGYILGTNVWWFALAATLQSLSWAFQSGTLSAFMQETLDGLKRSNDYVKIMAKLGAHVSLISVVIIMLLPLLVSVDMLLPFKLSLLFEAVGLIVVMLFVSPPQSESVEKKEKTIIELVKELKGSKLLSISIFLGFITAFLVTAQAFNIVTLESLGLPIIFIGLAAGISRIVWVIFGYTVSWWSAKINIKLFFLMDVFVVMGYLFSFVFISNPYILACIIGLVIGYKRGCEPVVTGYVLKQYMHNKRYKATLLSIKNQIAMLMQVPLIFGIGFVMDFSYQLGFAVLGLWAMIVLMPAYFIIRKH